MRKIIVTLGVASIFVTAVPAYAHAELATLSSYIFQGLYTLGLPGALANTIANLAIPALLGVSAASLHKGGKK